MTSDQRWLSTVQTTVVEALAANARLAPADIDPDVPMAALPGMDSIQLLRAVADLEEACDLAIPDDVLFQAKTARELAHLVADLIGGRP
ncbi:MAG TPA: acyl carrier protein [Planosporangium sp.]|nr:acyl carrier protein [Planosporangium sp.]